MSKNSEEDRLPILKPIFSEINTAQDFQKRPNDTTASNQNSVVTVPILSSDDTENPSDVEFHNVENQQEIHTIS